MPEKRRFAVLPRLGIAPTIKETVVAALDGAITERERDARGPIVVLDAGCGRQSALRHFRARVTRLVGCDIHAPREPIAYLDEFAEIDVCGTADGWPDGTFDVVLSNFTLEHFAEPELAMRNFRRWLRPGGTFVATTVNRRHPFVRAYLDMPKRWRDRLQPAVKATAADAHPLVGACNDPAIIQRVLGEAGFQGIQLRTVGNLARAWGRNPVGYVLGLVGDLIAQPLASRRSTILIIARA